jgi:hypothetical protein
VSSLVQDPQSILGIDVDHEHGVRQVLVDKLQVLKAESQLRILKAES